MRRLVLTASIIMAGFAFSVIGDAEESEGSNWLPSYRTISHLEGLIAMPRGARSIDAYARYYTGVEEANRRLIRGIFILARAGGRYPPGPHIVRALEMPRLLDGGCTVVSVTFDIQADRIQTVTCNGSA